MFKILLFCCFLVFINSSTMDQLIFVSLHSRHGARAPLEVDENKKDFLGEYWTNPGELTPAGHRMEYILGLRNRQRYINIFGFLSQKYDPHEILVYSTNVNRTILSIASQLQGLYPMYNKSGEYLTKEQIKVSKPPINVDYDEINKEIENIKNSSLPNYMTIIPIHTRSFSERIMNVQDSNGCNEVVNRTREFNKLNNELVVDETKKFNEKYSQTLNSYFNNPDDFKYDFNYISLFCDTVVCDDSDGRTMEDFIKKTNLDKDELVEDCKNAIVINFREDFFGDKKNDVILLGVSTKMKELLYFMKLKIDEDMNNKDNEETNKNVADYTKPKMVIYSGQDSTLTPEELFMIKYFGKKDQNFIYPTYTTQLAFEVTRDKEKPKDLDYTSYKVTFYVNDDEFVVTDFQTFKDTIEKTVWSDKQVSEYCEDEVKTEEDGKNEEDVKTEDGKSDSNSKMQLYALIGVGCLAFIFIIIIICLCVKLHNMDKKESSSPGNEGLMNENENEI